MPTPRVGGTFAPPLTEDRLAEYDRLAAAAPPQVAEAMTALSGMVRDYLKTKTVRAAGRAHPSGRGLIHDLGKADVDRLDPVVPWAEELDMYALLFDRIDPRSDRGLRNAAFHLLWYGRELVLDRHPMTSDLL